MNTRIITPINVTAETTSTRTSGGAISTLPATPAEGIEDQTEQTTPRNGIARLLRILGAVVLVASAVTFAMQGWSGLDSLGRYYAFLVFTVVLSAAGVFCGLTLKEDKGARTFLGLGAAFLPAHFLQLGALLYSVVLGTPQHLHELFVLRAPSLLAAVLAAGIALPLLAGVAFFGLSALARSEARVLTAVYLTLNAFLLLPVREADYVALFSLGAFALLSGFEFRRFSRAAAMSTREGAMVRAMLAAPLFCLVGRSVALYPLSQFFGSIMLAMLSFILLVAVPQWARNKEVMRLCEFASFGSAAMSWVLLVGALGFSDLPQLATPMTFLPMALIFSGMSLVVPSGGAGYRRLASWIAIGAVLVQLFTVPGLASSFLCIVTAVLTTVAAFTAEDRGLLVSGVFGLGAGLLYHLRYAVDFYTLSPWLSLALTGVLIVIGSSYLERNSGQINRQISAFRERIAGWR